MVLKPLEVLWKGLKTLTDHVKTKKEELQAHLAESQPISAEDEQWLDHDANLVDEQQVLENADETRLFYRQVLSFLSGSWTSRTDLMDRMAPDCGLSNTHSSGVKGNKVWLTYLLTSNANGSEKLHPLVIGKAKKPRAFLNKPATELGFKYQSNVKAWITANIYQDWLWQWDHELGATQCKIVLLQDHFSGHIVPIGLQNIRVVNFRPNLTAHVQPIDQGIIQCFKAHYCAKYIQRAVHSYDRC